MSICIAKRDDEQFPCIDYQFATIVHNEYQMSIKTQQQGSHSVFAQCWQQVYTPSQDNPSDAYISQEQLARWTTLVFQKRKQSQLLQPLSVEEQINQFMLEVHQLDQASVTNVMFKYEEAVEFYNWIIQKKVVPPQPQNDQQQPADQEKDEQKDQQKQGQGENAINGEEKLGEGKEDKEEQQQVKQEKPQKKEEEEKYMYPRGDSQTPKIQEEAQPEEDPNQFNEFNKQIKDNGQPQDTNEISKNYRQFLNAVFDHYCRMSYAAANGPTFQQIQHKTQIMTVNKFMIFCKQFGVIKLNSMSRAVLVEMFKKHSQFYKEMNFHQFIEILVKISQMVYSPESQEEASEKSQEFEQFLYFLEVNNSAAFKKKMVSLGITYRPNGQSTIKKVAPSNYKFKFAPANGKTKQQIQQQIEERKKFRSENRIKATTASKSTAHMQKRDFSKRHINKAEIEQREKRNNQDRFKVQSHPQKKTTNKLPPPIPPPKRSMPPKQQEPVVTGYANIYRLKMGKQLGSNDSRLRLNQVVQEARKMMVDSESDRCQTENYEKVHGYARGTPYSDLDHFTGLHTPIEPPSRDKTYSEYGVHSEREPLIYSQQGLQKMNKYMPYGHNFLEKRAQDKQAEDPDLKGIVDNDSQDDQFLMEHLSRQRKKDLISQRIEKKIRQIDQTE